MTLKEAVQLGSGRRQRGRGFLKDLVKMGRNQALIAGAKIGADVIKKRKNIKNALLTHGLNAVKNTGLFALNRGGAKHALTAAARTGLDVLENKRSLKDAVKTHGVQALKQRLNLVCKFNKDDGSNLTGAGSTCAPVNNIFHSLFTEIDLSVNGKIVTPGTDTYPYKVYLEKLLSYKPRTLMTQMRACSLWEKDTAGHMDEEGVADLGVAQNKTFDVTPGENGGADTVTIDKPIIPELPANSKNEGFRKRHQAIKDRTQSKITDHLFQGQMPKRIILGFVDNAAFNGDKTKNPFHFQNVGIKKLDFSINGETMSTRCFEPNFNEDLYLRSYLSLYQALGKLGEDWAPDITIEEYKNGYTFWGWDFTKDQEAQSDKFHIIETGNLREVQFTNNTVNTLNCVVYAEFDNLLEINKQREVSIDY
ncbi:uncharacterized protein F54H12.2-like [Saccostrea echinata]|uniref:uncharacterized protein F54H12.2-like n=1 Tax=Saccostrea echinata TaxID=191078 RepID=UPI002A7FCC39|nr:uncharacterized protein F54H12.2-like [Saccostrea echinata]